MRRAMLIAFAALALASCGKRPRNLEPPSQVQDQQVYPKRYPPPDQPGERF